MSSAADLFALFKLHQVDASIAEIKKKAAAFDPTRTERAAIEALRPEWEAATGEAAALHSEQTDLELQQKSLDEKLKKIDKELYSGKIVNPREVESYQKEIAILKAKRSAMDSRILEIWDRMPTAKEAADQADAKMGKLRALLEQKKHESQRGRSALETDFKAKAASRATLARAVPAGLLAQYEAIRKKMGGVGMAEITDGSSCSGCGTILPTKTVLMVQESKVITCETCHRILFVLMPEP